MNIASLTDAEVHTCTEASTKFEEMADKDIIFEKISDGVSQVLKAYSI